jgi:hypothetical protein
MRCYNAAMNKPFQLSLPRLLVATALLGAGLESLSLRGKATSGAAFFGVLFGGWALLGASGVVLFCRPTKWVVLIAVAAGLIGVVGTMTFAYLVFWSVKQ